MASVPLLQKNARGSPEKAARRAATWPCSGWIVEVRGVQQRRRLFGHGA